MNYIYFIPPFLLIVGIILIIVSATKKETPEEKKKSSTLLNVGISLISLSVVLIFVFLYIHKDERKSKAESLLSETDTEKYLKTCKELVNSSKDEGIIKDYDRMVAERPQSEVKNFCGNYAKNILGKK